MSWAIPPDVAWEAGGPDDMLWAVRVGIGRIIGLPPAAQAIWAAANGRHSARQVVDELAARMGWNADDIDTSVAAFIDRLVECGLLVETENTQ